MCFVSFFVFLFLLSLTKDMTGKVRVEHILKFWPLISLGCVCGGGGHFFRQMLPFCKLLNYIIMMMVWCVAFETFVTAGHVF